MKSAILAAIAGFSVAFVAGVVSAPDASAEESYIARCRSNRDCDGFGRTYCDGPGLCIFNPDDITYGHCECA